MYNVLAIGLLVLFIILLGFSPIGIIFIIVILIGYITRFLYLIDMILLFLFFMSNDMLVGYIYIYVCILFFELFCSVFNR